MTSQRGDRREEEQVENLLGALCLAVGDRVHHAVNAAAGQADSAAAALSALHHFLVGPSIEVLRQVPGITHSGAVRLIDRLEDAGLVRRQQPPGQRSTRVTLTPAGRRAAVRVVEARRSALPGCDRSGGAVRGFAYRPGADRWAAFIDRFHDWYSARASGESTSPSVG